MRIRSHITPRTFDADVDTPSGRCPGPISRHSPLTRRSLLEVGAIGATGLGLADLMRLRAEAGAAGAADDTAVILLWLPGGLPHMEMYDMKPEAPAEYRGEFKPIPTNVPGIEVSELLPLHAKVADRFTLIRSICHEQIQHPGGSRRMLTARFPKDELSDEQDAPCAASIVGKMREHVSRGIPNNILIGAGSSVFGPAYLGPAYNPFRIGDNPSDKNFQVKNLSLTAEMAARLADRRALLGGIDRLKRDIDRSGAMAAMDSFTTKAYELLTSPASRAAFDLTQEPAAVRERYGDHNWGQQALMARRLVEAGASFVTVNMDHPVDPKRTMPAQCFGNWDCHAINCNVFIDSRWRLPYFDQAATALIEDLYARGLDKRVMLVAMGEFGHTPRVNYTVGNNGIMQPGRDHWCRAMSVLVSGGGMRMGQVVGSTTDKGEDPKDRRMTPNDLWATVYRHLGIDYNHALLDHTGRPMPILPFGSPIRELV